jgi:phosphohistidine swiveling domain-containing protein
MGAAWRVGRMRAALPLIASAIVEKIDERLANVPDIRELTNEQLLDVMLQSRRHLISLHGFEVLCGMLEPDEDGAATGAALALRSLALANSEGFEAEDIVADHPEVLALTPPAIQETIELPTTTSMALSCDAPSTALGPREALRLRVRWVQELSARAAWELGTRMIPARLLGKADQIAQMSLDEITVMVEQGEVPDDLQTRSTPVSAPLPNAFRVSKDGSPIPVQTDRKGDAARGAGGGRGMGRVHHGTEPQHGDVLVVRTLDPNLAPLLPTLGGLVAETGNVLSHLAILAREFGVPTVVGRDGATEAFPEGTVVIVDGSTGEVSEVSEA